MPKFNLTVIQNFNPEINPDVFQIPPKILCIHYLVGISHFAKFRKNQMVTV